MPTGLPLPPSGSAGGGGPLGYGSEGSTSILDDISAHLGRSDVLSHLFDFVERLQIPSWEEYRTTLVVAIHDCAASVTSLSRLLYLTLRPVCILLTLTVRCLWSRCVLPALLHLWVWQTSLTPFQLCVEFGVVATVALLYLLRRYIRRRRFIPRISSWYRTKRDRIVDRYHEAVENVARTSLLLARIFPHAVFALVVIGVEYTYWGRWVVRSVAVETYSVELLSLWMPAVRTVLCLGRWKRRRNLATMRDEVATAAVGGGGDDPNSESSGGKGKGRSAAKAGKGKGASSSSSSTSSSSSSGGKLSGRIAMFENASSSSGASKVPPVAGTPSRKWSPKKKAVRAAGMSKADGVTEGEDDDGEALASQMIELLKYWVVYSLLLAVAETLALLPFVGAVFGGGGGEVPPVAFAAADHGVTASTWAVAVGTVRRLWRHRAHHARECRLILLVWAWTFQGLQGGGPSRGRGHGQGHGRREGSGGNKEGIGLALAASPLDVVFSKLAVLAGPYYRGMKPSSHVHPPRGNHRHPDANGVPTPAAATAASYDAASSPPPYAHKTGLAYTFLSKLDSFLHVAVFCKLVSQGTKDRILWVMSEGTNYLPSAVTLFMPGYFTRFGCIYAGEVVPSGYGMRSVTTFRFPSKDEAAESDLVRQLQYWVAYHVLLRTVIVSWAGMALGGVIPLIRFVPIWAHLQLVVVLAMQLLDGSDLAYGGMERELVVLGLLDPEYTNVLIGGGGGSTAPRPDVNSSVTVRALRKMMSSLPAASSAGDGGGSGGVDEGRVDDGGGDRGGGNADGGAERASEENCGYVDADRRGGRDCDTSESVSTLEDSPSSEAGGEKSGDSNGSDDKGADANGAKKARGENGGTEKKLPGSPSSSDAVAEDVGTDATSDAQQ